MKSKLTLLIGGLLLTAATASCSMRVVVDSSEATQATSSVEPADSSEAATSASIEASSEASSSESSSAEASSSESSSAEVSSEEASSQEASSESSSESSSEVVHVSSLTLNATSLEISKEGSATLTATIAPEDAYDKVVTWKSLDEGIATVTKEGVVTGVAVGATTIIATSRDGGKTAFCTVTVKDNVISVTGVTLNVENLNMVEGETETLVATVAPENAANKAVEWSSDNKSVATVDSNGVVTAVSAGEAFITVRTSDGGFECSIEVIVEAAPEEVIAITGIELSSSTGLSMVPCGAKLPLTATLTPANTTQTGIVWESSDTSIATVSGGVVTGVAAGSATITATSSVNSEITDTFTVTVEQVDVDLESVAIYVAGEEASAANMYEGDFLQLASVLTPANTTQHGISWSSNNASVATVNSDGLVTAVKAGTATITLQPTDNSSVSPATIIITVAKKPVPITAITVKAENDATHMYVGNTLQMTAELDPIDTTDTGVVWSSLNEDYATIDSAGLVTAIAEGEVTIRCTSVNASAVYGEYTIDVYQTHGENKNIDVISFAGPSSIEQSFRNNVADLDPVSTIKTKGADASTREEDTFFENADGSYDVYKVGTDNPFKLSFSASGVDENLDDVAVANLELTASLYEKSGDTYGTESVLATYATVNDAKTSFQFNADAVGKTFKLRVEPDSSKYASVSANCYFEHVFQVIEGYNVYSWSDLVKMDNRSSNIYQDDAENNCYDSMVLQKDLTLKQSDLPSGMKWTSDDVQEYIANNSADWQTFMDQIIYDEDQDIYFTYEVEVSDGIYENKLITTKKEAKDVFVDSPIDDIDVLVHKTADSETFSFEGNYFKIDYSHLKPVVKFMDVDLLSEYAQSEGGHSSFFGRDVSAACTGTYNMKNVSSKGNGTRSAHDISPAGGLMFMKNKVAELNVSNVLAYSTFTTFDAEGASPTARGVVNLDRVKAFDCYNIMFYNYGSDVNITNSLSCRAGGSIIMNDEVYALDLSGSSVDEKTLFRPAHTDVKNSFFESWVSGTEAWFSTKSASSLVTALTTMAGPDGFIGKNRDDFGSHYTFAEKKTLANDETALYANLIAIDCHGNNMLGNTYAQGTALQGTITFDDTPALNMANLATAGKDVAAYKTMMDATSSNGFLFEGSAGGSGALYNPDFSEGIHYQSGLASIDSAFANDCVTFSAAKGAIAALNNSAAEAAAAAAQYEAASDAEHAAYYNAVAATVSGAATQLKNAFDAFYSSPYMAAYISPAYGLNYIGAVLGCGAYVIE